MSPLVFWQPQLYICMHIAIHRLKVEQKQAYEPPLHVEKTALVHKTQITTTKYAYYRYNYS